MNENKLIASVVVFKELLDNNKDIYDIISEFLKAGIIDKQKWNFTSNDLKNLIVEVFDFKLPEAVIKTVLKKRLIKAHFITLNNGIYSVKNIKESINPTFEKKYLEKKKIYKKTEDEFIDYIERKKAKKFDSSEKNLLRKNINLFLLGDKTSNTYTQEISEYIILKKNDKSFTNRLNTVKEGVVLYTGIQYSPDLNELGKWQRPLTIFLDTEMLFYYLGFSGEVYKNIFADFIKLVREINLSNPKKVIQLKYFTETKTEIDNFFHAAILIIENKMSLDPSKAAMKDIVNGCKSKSDIIVKKNKFFSDLKTSGIFLEEERDYYSNPIFNIEGNEVISKLGKESEINDRDFDEEHCKNILKLFTKINFLRKGVSDKGFENCRYILLTGNKYSHFLAHNPEIKVNDKDIPFATDIDFMTDKFWFNLKKGFGTSEDIPKSFDMITKAQIILSSQINNTVQEKYTALNEKYKNGEITKQEAISLNYELRKNSLKPEEVTETSVTDSLAFINSFTIESHLREKEILNQKVIEGEKAKSKLKKIQLNQRSKKNKKFKLLVKTLKIISFGVFVSSVIIIYYLGYLGVNKIKTENDSLLSIISSFIGIIVLFPFWKYLKKYNKYINDKLFSWYKNKIV